MADNDPAIRQTYLVLETRDQDGAAEMVPACDEGEMLEGEVWSQ